jgi:hypothetical protein
MDIVNKDYLLAITNLSNKLETNETNFDEELKVINSNNEQEKVFQLVDLIIGWTEQPNISKESLLYIINNLENLIDKEYFIQNIKISNLLNSDIINNKDNVKQYLDEIFAKNISFERSKSEYSFYNKLMMLSLSMHDNNYTKAIINKLQNI